MLTACGLSQCGKTYWIFQYIKEMIEPTPNKIIYLYTAKEPIYDEMKIIIEAQKINIKFIECNKGIPPASDLQTNLSNTTLVVLDDLMTVATSSKENTDNLDNFASRDSHHSNISVIFTCQNLTYGGEITKFAC